jgi:hypothetical protein
MEDYPRYRDKEYRLVLERRDNAITNWRKTIVLIPDYRLKFPDYKKPDLSLLDETQRAIAEEYLNAKAAYKAFVLGRLNITLEEPDIYP